MHYYRDEIRETPRQQALRELREAEEADEAQMPTVRLVNLLLAAVLLWIALIVLFLTRVAPLFGWFQ